MLKNKEMKQQNILKGENSMNNKDIEVLPDITVPLNILYYNYRLSDEFILSLEKIFNPYLVDYSRYIDISNLEAITFTCEDYYEEAINSIDRGFVISNRIKPSIDGAAMTITLKKDSNIKSHIVFNVNKWTKDEENLLTGHTLSIIAHEMAHVEITKNLYNYKADICFPKSFPSFRKGKGFDISKSSIEEFGACKKSYLVDKENISLKYFECLLIKHLNEINVSQMKFIDEFKNEINNNINYYDACFNYAEKSYENYGRLFIISSYYLGSRANNIEHHINIKEHKLFKYIKELLIFLNEAYKNYPYWTDSSFSDIQSLLEYILINEAKINFRTNMIGIDDFTVDL